MPDAPSLPPPPPTWQDPDPSGCPLSSTGVPLRAGDLLGTWRVVFVVGWVGVLLGYVALWRSSRTMGLATWWLGSMSEPRVVVVQVLPLVVPVLLTVGGLRGIRFLPYLGLVGSVALTAIGTGDLSGFERLAYVQFGLAAAGACISLASFAGMLRPARRVAAPPSVPSPETTALLDDDHPVGR